jgi:ABC-type glycerol-3-phosphate transport system permease component
MSSTTTRSTATADTAIANAPMQRRRRKSIDWSTVFRHLFLIVFGITIIYPVLWLIFSTMKPNNEIFSQVNLIPRQWEFGNFAEGWFAIRGYSFGLFFRNSFIISGLSIIGTVISTSFAAYAFARLRFPFKKILFAVLLSTMMLPPQIILVPRYILMSALGWIDTFLPIAGPKFFGSFGVFVFLLTQFIRGIPKELDEAAIIDGCGRMRFLLSILLPLMKPALFTVALFTFMWTWQDFMGPLIYINSIELYPLPLALNLFLDATAATNWGALFSMMVLSILPIIVIFFVAQKYFVQGIVTTGMKG